VGQHSALVSRGICENLLIINPLATSSGFLNRAHVVSKAAQFLDSRKGKSSSA
jgi:hypothetical protein